MQFFRNFIIEGIGFSGCAASMILIALVRRRKSPAEIRRALVLAAVVVLVLNPLLRQALDRLPGDYIVERCARFNISRVGVGGTMRVATCVSGCNANRSWAFSDPFVLNRVLRPDQFGRDPDPDHNPDGAACANLKLAGDDKGLLCPAHLKCVAECSAGQSMCAGRDCPAPPSTWLAAETALNATCTSRNEACAGERNDARLSCGALAQQVGEKDSTSGLHTSGVGSFGRRVCVTNTTGFEVLSACMLKPWWSRGTDFGAEEFEQTNALQKLLIALVFEPLFGRFGVFAYLAPSLVGSAIGCYLMDPDKGNTPELHRAIFGTAALIFWPGIVLTLFLLGSKADDAGLQAGSHIRLWCGALELAMIGICLSHFEGRTDVLKSKFFMFLRRAGMVSLSLWLLQWVDLVWVIIVSAIGGDTGIWESKATGNGSYRGNVWLLFPIVFGFWYNVLSFWASKSFVGSAEALQMKFTGRNSGRMDTKAMLEDAQPMFGERNATATPSCPASCAAGCCLLCGLCASKEEDASEQASRSLMPGPARGDAPM